MRRLIFAVAMIATLACGKRKEATPSPVASSSGLAGTIAAGDAAAASQFVRGFYPPEQNAWRWTQKEFTVRLKPPDGAATRGAALRLRFTIADAVLAKTGPLTLSATVGSVPQEPQTFAAAGEQIYLRDIAAGALTGEAVEVTFQVDKALPPGDADRRELALIVSSASLEPRK